MPTVEIRNFEDTIVLYFGGETSRINAYTLASTLVAFADAAKAANAVLNPGYDVEVVVEALAGGSFRATIRTIFKEAGNLFSKDGLKAIVLGVLASVVYEHTLAPNKDVVVNVNSGEVVIQQGETKIIVPRAVHEGAKAAKDSPGFRKAIGDVARAIEADPEVRSFGVGTGPALSDIAIPRERIAALSTWILEPDGDERELVETTDLQILRAILERSRRLWQFAWNGVRISAPVVDEKFYQDFFARRITVAPGDSLRVKLVVHQKRDPGHGVFMNTSYEVVEVIKHIARSSTEQLPLPPP